MRHLILALLFALLPLRGWVGDVMAMEMVTAKRVPSQAAAPDQGAMAADCPGHAAGHADMEPAAADCDAACTACQICHAIALAPVFPLLTSDPLPAARPQATHHRFASAERAPGFKPPIF